jgi:hypothetical protein
LFTFASVTSKKTARSSCRCSLLSKKQKLKRIVATVAVIEEETAVVIEEVVVAETVVHLSAVDAAEIAAVIEAVAGAVTADSVGKLSDTENTKASCTQLAFLVSGNSRILTA